MELKIGQTDCKCAEVGQTDNDGAEIGQTNTCVTIVQERAIT